ncbi:MAG: hypothetical protein GXO23_02710 [Crenarchaeota archaeon]|nr:hypothetical protein [Thermoproteota archaeon]
MSAKKKKKSFLIIALVAIIVAEAGYILASFGIFSLGGGRPRARMLDLYIDMVCRLAGGTKDICSNTVMRTLSSYQSYNKMAIRIVDLNYCKNMTLLRDQAIYLLNISKPLVDVFYTPSNNVTKIMVSLIESINKTLGWKLNTLEYNVYTISYPSLFADALEWAAVLPHKIYSPNMTYTVLRGENETLTLQVNSTKPRAILLIVQANLTFNTKLPRNLPPGKLLESMLNVTAHERLTYKNKTKTVRALAVPFPVYVGDRSMTVNIAVIYVVSGLTNMSMSMYSPHLVNSSMYYTIYNFETPLVVIGDKVSGTMQCLIVGYRNLTQFIDLVSRCLR